MEKPKSITGDAEHAGRPIEQIKNAPEIVRHIREQAIPEARKYVDTPECISALQNLEEYLSQSITPCQSFHFPLPECARKIFELSHDWEVTQDTLNRWAVDELDAKATLFIDVENLCEGCRECIGFTQHCFPGQHVDEGAIFDDVVGLGWRIIGNQVAITYASFEWEGESVDTGQYGMPQRELSDLFNRSLPQGLAMVYFDVDEANGLYVLMKTENLKCIDLLC